MGRMKIHPSRRNQTRIPVQIPVNIYRAEKPKEAIEAAITNISLGGAFIECRVPVSIDQELMLEIRFGEGKIIPVKVVETEKEKPEPPALEVAMSRVRWTKDAAASGFGVEFSGLKPDLQEYLQKLLRYFEGLTRAGVTF